MTNIYRIAVIGSAIALAALTGCKKSGSTDATASASSESGAAVSATVDVLVYKSKFPAKFKKYDEVLEKSFKITSALTNARSNVDNFSSSLTGLVAAGKEAAATDPAAALKGYVDGLAAQGVQLAVKVTVAAEAVSFEVTVTGPEVIPAEVQSSIESFKTLINSLPAALKDLSAAVTTSVDVAKQCKELAESAKKDFSGFDAVHAPKAIAALTEAATELSTAPAKAQELVTSVQGLIDTIKAQFAS